jgi:hypothetical protein
MALYYPSCPNPLPSYNCSACPPSENGRVSSVAFVKNSYTFSSYSNTAEWTTAVNAGNAIVIWQTQGSYDGGATTEQPGYGRIPFYNGNTVHTVVFKDPNATENIDFYNIARLTSEYTLVFLTSSKLWAVQSPVVITPKLPITDDLNSVVSIECTVKWTYPALPIPYSIPSGIFASCYIV